MEWRTYHAYRRWMDRWLPHILYGADGARAEAENRANTTSDVAELPGGSIVRADA
jgi:hypothetical protein